MNNPFQRIKLNDEVKAPKQVLGKDLPKYSEKRLLPGADFVVCSEDLRSRAGVREG